MQIAEPHNAIVPPSAAAVRSLFQEINSAQKKPAILKITQPYAQEFVPKQVSCALPLPMMELYNPETLHMDYLSLLRACEAAFETITVRMNRTTTFLY